MELATLPRGRIARVRTIALRTTVGLVAAAVLVATFLRLVNVGAVFHRLTHLRIAPAVACGIAFLGAYVVRALRWRCLLRPCQVGVGRIIAIYQIATFVNWLLPVRGGELVKSLLLRHSDGIPISRSLATVGMDKAMDLLPAVLLLALLPFVGLQLTGLLWLLLSSALVVVGFSTFALVLAAWRRDRAVALLRTLLAAMLPRRLRERIEPWVVTFVDTLIALIRQPRLLATAVGYTALAVSLDAVFCYLAFEAVGARLAVPVVLYGYTFYNLAFILPTPPGQVGSNELVGLLIFAGMFGVNRSAVGAMFLFSHPWTAVLMTCSGLVCLSLMGLSVRTTLRMARARPQEEST